MKAEETVMELRRRVRLAKLMSPPLAETFTTLADIDTVRSSTQSPRTLFLSPIPNHCHSANLKYSPCSTTCSTLLPLFYFSFFQMTPHLPITLPLPSQWLAAVVLKYRRPLHFSEAVAASAAVSHCHSVCISLSFQQTRLLFAVVFCCCLLFIFKGFFEAAAAAAVTGSVS